MKYLKKFWPLYMITGVLFVISALSTESFIETIAENTPVPRNYTIIIDPGHGGIDGGATSCTGVLESQINLEIGLRLNDLCHLMGYHTRMTRTSDVSIYTEGNSIAAKKASDLRQRVKIVNDTENAILISLHQNIFSDSQYSGAQVFYTDTQGSSELAQILQAAFVESINTGSSRKAKAATNIYLMRHIQKTGILVECGFLSNPEEEAKLRSENYQKEICCVIVSALSKYLSP